MVTWLSLGTEIPDGAFLVRSGEILGSFGLE